MVDLEALQTHLNYTFKDISFLEIALTHSSAKKTSNNTNYERLEFLGDRVVNLVIADLLFQNFPDEQEGALAKRHSALVRTETLAQTARTIELGEFMMLSDAERQSGGHDNDNILADVMESVIAAIYLDSNFDTAKIFVKNVLGDRLYNMSKPPSDPKTALQEWSQSRNLGLPTYKIINQQGPDHAPEFTVEVCIEGYSSQTATSSSKKRAEKEAAETMLKVLGS